MSAAAETRAPVHSDLPHFIGALVLLAALTVLPFAGIGPTSWRECVGSGEANASAAPAADPPAPAPPAPASQPPTPTLSAAPTAPAPTSSADVVSAPAAPTPAVAMPKAVVHFGFDSDELPAGWRNTLAPVIALLRVNADARAQISGFHDPRGNRLYNEDLAERRAVAVRNALERSGIARERIALARPARAAGGGTPQAARRTEVTIVAAQPVH